MQISHMSSLVYLLWIVNLLAVVFGTMILLRKRLLCGPRYLEDAARIDGCGFLGVYWHVTLPRIRPALGLIVILILAAACDDVTAPLIEAGSPGQSAGQVSVGGVPLEAFGFAMAGLLFLVPPVMALFYVARRPSPKS